MTTFSCMECGRKFKTTKGAERAALNGCPGCGGTDIDISPVQAAKSAVRTTGEPQAVVSRQFAEAFGMIGLPNTHIVG